MKEIFQPIFSLLPQVRSPTYRVPFKEKLKWTGVVLILYFVLGQIALFGLSPTAVDQFTPSYVPYWPVNSVPSSPWVLGP